MKMKKTFTLFLIGMAMIAVLSGCKEEPVEPSLPDQLGTISFDHERFGAGQPITVTCMLPGVSMNEIASVAYRFYINDQGPFSLEEKEGTLTYTFSLDTTKVGKNRIKFEVEYYFKKTEGNARSSKAIAGEKEFTLEKCDVRSSFWKDNVAITLINCPGLQQNPDYPEMYNGIFKDELSISTAQITVGYIFKNDELNQVTELDYERSYSETHIEGYFAHYAELKRKLARLYGESITSNEIKRGDAEEPLKDYTDPETTMEYKKQIGEELLSGEIELYCEFKTEKTTVALKAFLHNGSVNYTRTYISL